MYSQGSVLLGLASVVNRLELCQDHKGMHLLAFFRVFTMSDVEYRSSSITCIHCRVKAACVRWKWVHHEGLPSEFSSICQTDIRILC